MNRSKFKFGDFIRPFQIDALGIRGSLVRMQKTVQSLTGDNRYPKDIKILLATAAALAGALTSGIKYKGNFSLQVQGDGPVGLLLIDISSDGDIRGHAKFDYQNLPCPENSDPLIPRLLGAGYLAFTVDQGPDTNRYQGITELKGQTLTDCAQTYFRDSEQLETVLLSGSTLGKDQDIRAGAFIIQRIADSPANAKNWKEQKRPWSEAAILAATLTKSELLDPNIDAADLLLRLFHEHEVRVFNVNSVRHRCRCSRERVSSTLSSFPEKEIRALKINGVVRVTCEFCNIEYEFNDTDLHALYDETKIH